MGSKLSAAVGAARAPRVLENSLPTKLSMGMVVTIAKYDVIAIFFNLNRQMLDLDVKTNWN